MKSEALAFITVLNNNVQLLAAAVQCVVLN